jgi:hypothetical protein
VWSYWRPTNWTTQSWWTFNSRLLPAFPTGWSRAWSTCVFLTVNKSSWSQNCCTSFHHDHSNSAAYKLPLLLEDISLQARLNKWLWHGSTPHHFGAQVTQYINRCCVNHWIGHGGLHNWPPHSPDLAPLDFYLLIHEGLGVERETADTKLTIMAHHGWCCSHTESWKHTESNMCCFKTSLLVHNQSRR